MTLKVVVDNTVELPVYNFKDMAACARRWADDLEAGKHGEPTRVIIVLVLDDGLSIHIKGENCSPYELMGLFEAAKLRVFADDAIEE